MIKQWGFVHAPIGASASRRAELLVGYPFGFDVRGGSAFGISCHPRFGTSAFITHTDRLVTVFIAGVDRSAWVGIGIRRSQQTGAGSVSTCTFTLNNANGRAHFKPNQNEEVLIYVRDDEGNRRRFFAGYVRSVKERLEGGTSGLITSEVTCSDYGSLLTRRIVGRHYELLEGGIATVTLINMLEEFVPEITLGSYPASVNLVNLGIQDFNYIPASECASQICQKADCNYRVDYFQKLNLFTASEGYESAPYTLTPGDGHFLRAPEFTTSDSGRANRVGVRNSRDMAPIFTDTFILAAETGLIGPVNAAFALKPVVTLDDVPLTVTEFGSWDDPWDIAYSIDGRTLQPNPANGPLTGTLLVKYPSRLSYIAWAPDGTADSTLATLALIDQALYGKSEVIIEAKDLADIDAMQAMADGLLRKYVSDPIQLSFASDKYGWEAGQQVTSNIPGYEGDYLIESVDSEEQGKAFFRHSVRASNSIQRSASGIRAFGSLIASGRQAVDRITYKIGFTLAETLDGLTNPGLTTGEHPSNQRIAEKDGTLRDVTVFFRSSVLGSPLVLTTTDCTFDIYKNGVSIFGTTKLVWPAGANTVQTRFLFASNPLTVQRGDVFTCEVLTADSAAMDGKIELTVLG